MSRGWICTIIIIPVVCISLTSPCDYLTTACSPSLIQELTRWKSGNRADFCPAIEPKLQNFESWSLSDSLLLSSGFPIDPVQSNYVRQVPDAVFSFVNPTPLKTKVRLVAISDDVLQNILDLNPDDCENSTEFLDFISGNTIMKGSIPMAHRYGGHQFGSWASQLGDGRAHLLGEYVNKNHERWELQLKGSGKTPYSRRGDGRAVLRSSVREFLCSEAFHYLGIPTSRAAAFIVSNDPVIRDQFYNGNITQERAAVVLRLAPSWFRIGSLEILEENSEIDLLRHLVDFIITNHFKTDIDPDSTERYVEFFKTVFDRTINTVVKWMSVGFAHGVCNTDNFSILGLTIDFGPFGFVENYDGDFVPNTSDDEGRYRLEQQASVAMYNLDKLRIAILPLLSKKQRAKVKEILNNFGGKYQELLNNEFRKKLGIFNKLEKDEFLIGSLFYLMQETSPDFTMTFRELSDLENKNFDVKLIPKSMWALRDVAKHKHFPKWLESYRLRLLQNPSNITDKVRRKMMRSVNPRYVLRNWIAEQAIQKANNNDFSEVRKVLKILRNPFTKQKMAEESGFADRRPEWANELKVSCSS